MQHFISWKPGPESENFLPVCYSNYEEFSITIPNSPRSMAFQHIFQMLLCFSFPRAPQYMWWPRATCPDFLEFTRIDLATDQPLPSSIDLNFGFAALMLSLTPSFPWIRALPTVHRWGLKQTEKHISQSSGEGKMIYSPSMQIIGAGGPFLICSVVNISASFHLRILFIQPWDWDRKYVASFCLYQKISIHRWLFLQLEKMEVKSSVQIAS